MTFTWLGDLSTDLDLVRFHIGDTEEKGAYLQDETINALLTSEGSVGGAVIASIKYILTQLSTPNFRKDWLAVDYEKARKGFEMLLDMKGTEFGIDPTGVEARATVSVARRIDSYESDDSFNPADPNEEKAYYSGDG